MMLQRKCTPRCDVACFGMLDAAGTQSLQSFRTQHGFPHADAVILQIARLQREVEKLAADVKAKSAEVGCRSMIRGT
jgi:hypothetical protein